MSDIEWRFQTDPWRPAGDIARPFVRHANPDPSPGMIWRYSPDRAQIEFSVLIPTLDGSRDGKINKLLAQIALQGIDGVEIIIIKGDSRQGRAINIGAALARGRYLITLDDDTALPDCLTFSKLRAALEKHPDIGIAGGNNVVPDDARPFVRRVMQEIPRRSWEAVCEITDSDLAEHPCLMMRREEFIALGGENEMIPRGLDPYLRQVYHKSNKRVVVVPRVIYHHLPPENFNKLMRQFYRNGRQAAFTNRNYPQWVLETPPGHGPFKAKQPLALRLFRFPLRLLQALVTGKPIWFLCEFVYALGFISGYVVSAERS